MNIISTFRGDHYFLSNYFGCDVEYKGLLFPSSEHAFAAAKTDNDRDIKRIQEADSPGEAKKLGRSVDLIDDWDRVKFGEMRKILVSKFDPERNRRLKRKLLRTYPDILVEGNSWHDQIWGSCFCDRCGDSGNNALGHLLMEVRFNLYVSK